MGQAFSNSTDIFANEEDRKHGKNPRVEVVHCATKVEVSGQGSIFEDVERFRIRSDATAPREYEAKLSTRVVEAEKPERWIKHYSNSHKITDIFADEEDQKHGKSPTVKVVHSATKVEVSRQGQIFEDVQRFRSDITAPRECEAKTWERVLEAEKPERIKHYHSFHNTTDIFANEEGRKHGKSPQVEVVLDCATKVEVLRQGSIFEDMERFRSDTAVPREYEAKLCKIASEIEKLERLNKHYSNSHNITDIFANEEGRRHEKSPQVEVVQCATKVEVSRPGSVFERFRSDTPAPREYEAKLCKRVLKAEKPERWIKHYSSSHKILLVGEGDFSFSACLARAFGSANNMHSTSLNDIGFLMKNYKNSMSNINALKSRGCTVMHGVDVAEMAEHCMLEGLKFDRIVFNFPLAGFFLDESREAQISRNQKLVCSFLNNAKRMISENGEIHVTHKSMGFYLQWKLELLAMVCSLCLKEEVQFDKEDYPGYENKYGFGGDKNFNYKPSKTYKFVLHNQSKQLRGLYAYN